MDKWNWTEPTEEEFEKRRFEETFYRVYHKGEDGKTVVDYKFWAKDGDAALAVLNSFKEDHCGDGKEYFYSTSGYYVNCDGKRFDTPKELHETSLSDPYDEEIRKYDIDNVKSLRKRLFTEEKGMTVLRLAQFCRNTLERINAYEDSVRKLAEKIDSTDLERASEDEMDELLDGANKANEEYFELRNAESLTRIGHGVTESWSLYDHVLDDLLFNTKILLDEGMGWPCSFELKARDAIGVAADANIDKDTKTKVDDLASEMWHGELRKFRELIMSYRMLSDYGIEDENNAELFDYCNEHKSEIPLVEGTDGELDYRTLHGLARERWDKIWDWMREYGESLWS